MSGGLACRQSWLPGPPRSGSCPESAALADSVARECRCGDFLRPRVQLWRFAPRESAALAIWTARGSARVQHWRIPWPFGRQTCTVGDRVVDDCRQRCTLGVSLALVSTGCRDNAQIRRWKRHGLDNGSASDPPYPCRPRKAAGSAETRRESGGRPFIVQIAGRTPSLSADNRLKAAV